MLNKSVKRFINQAMDMQNAFIHKICYPACLKNWIYFFKNSSPQRRKERREMRIPPPVPLREGDKGGGKTPRNFLFCSLITFASFAPLRWTELLRFFDIPLLRD